MELKGTLDSNSLQEIFTTLARNKQIGTLIVSDGESKKYIYFARAGVRLLSSGKRKSVPLGDLLVKLNKITPDQLQAVLERQRETGEMMGKILSDWGLVTEEDIDEAVRSQIEEEIFDIFSWENATFAFTEGAPPKELFDPNQRATRLTFDVFQLVQDANERVQAMKEIKRLLPPPEAVFALGEFTELEYYEKDDTDPTKKVVTLIDGVRTVGDILEQVGLPRVDVARIFHELLTQKKIEKVSRAAAPASPDDARGDLESFIMKCEREIFNDPDNYQLRERLAQAYYDMGDLEKAILHLNLVSKAQLKDGQLEKALATTRRVAEVVPEDTEVRERLLHIYLEMRSIGEALEEAAILADLYTEAEEKEKVRNMYKLVLELVPDDTDMRRKLINVHIDLGDREAAAQEYEEIARIVQERGERHKLEEIYLKILRLTPHRSDIKKKLASMKTRPTIHIPRGRWSLVRRLVKWVAVLSVLGAVGYAGYHEFDARRTAKPVLADIRSMVRDGRYDEARDRLEALSAGHPYTVLAYLDLENLGKEIDQAEKKARQEQEDRQRLEVKRDYERFASISERKEKALKDIALPPEERIERLGQLRAEMAELAEAQRENEWIEKARAWVERHDSHRAEAKNLLARAEALEKDGDLLKGRKLRMELREKYADTETSLGLLFPYQITTEPPGARVFVRGELKGESPLLLYEPMDSNELLEVRVECEGYLPQDDSIFWDVTNKVTYHYVLRRKPLWVLRTDAPIQAAPEIDGSFLYFGSRDGFLYAVDLEAVRPEDEATWFPAWKYKNPSRPSKLWAVLHRPVVRSGFVYYGSTDNHLYAVHKGEELWHFPAGGIIRHRPVLAEDLLVFGCNVGKRARLTALQISAEDGSARSRWVFPPEEMPMRKAVTGPAVDPEQRVVFFGDTWGDIHVVDLQNGQPVTSFNTKMSIETSFLVFNGTLFFVGSDRALHAYDISDVRSAGAREVWTFPLPDAAHVAPVQFAGSLVQVTDGGHLLVLDVRSKGEYVRQWSYKIAGPVHARPVIAGTDVLVGSFDRNLYALNLLTGKLHWRFQTPGQIRGIAVRKNVIYCTCEEGVLFAIHER